MRFGEKYQVHSQKYIPSQRLDYNKNHTFKNSYLKKYFSQEPESLPQYKAFICASVKNIRYTLRNIFLVNGLITTKIALLKIHISKSILARNLKVYHSAGH